MCRTRCLQSTYSPPVGSIYAPKGLQIQISSGFYSEYFAKSLRKKINENLKHMKHESWFRTYRVNKMTHKICSNLRKHSEVSQCIVLTHSYNTTETNGGHVLGRQKQRQTECLLQSSWFLCFTNDLDCMHTNMHASAWATQASVVLLLDMNPSLWNSRLIMQTRKYLQNLHWRRI